MNSTPMDLLKSTADHGRLLTDGTVKFASGKDHKQSPLIMLLGNSQEMYQLFWRKYYATAKNSLLLETVSGSFG